MNKRYVDTYTVFDVETPNRKNDSICSIGIVRVEKGEVVFARHDLVDPEDAFDSFNVSIHGISPSMVRGQPSFPELWREISPYFLDNVLIAHNASFDLNVLSKCISACGEDIPELYSLCTLKLSKRFYSELGSFRLNNMCDYFHVELLNHHNALDDALACQGIFSCLKERHEITFEDVSVYRMNAQKTVGKLDKAKYEKALNELSGLIRGFSADKVVDNLEMVRLNHWVTTYKKYKKSTPFDSIIPLIVEILSDGMVSQNELHLLNSLCRDIEDESRDLGAFSGSTSSLQVFKSMLEGVLVSGELTREKLIHLKKWMDEQRSLSGTYPFDEIRNQMMGILMNETVEGYSRLKWIIDEYIDPVKSVQNECSDFTGKTICLTGNFVTGSKEQITALLERCGGTVLGTVTRKTEVLIVGGEGSRDWSFGNYGTKVKKAMEMRSKGIEIDIITEEELSGFLQINKLSL